MDDLAQWLGAQLDEDQRIVSRALDHVDAEWRLDAARNVVFCRRLTVSGRQSTPVTAIEWRYPRVGAPALAPHVAEHDPARVLREIDAKRRMIGRINSHATMMGWDEVHGDLLRLLAAPYADRPGYREEWRP
ncbi:DUF6221 family protein [Streptomyces sp. NPDC007084]|uniref:DUF6221 family protein n=1 Tax=Streptomyces sp. NPDC007084 TaxID=3154313 RepID=UPI003453D6FA